MNDGGHKNNNESQIEICFFGGFSLLFFLLLDSLVTKTLPLPTLRRSFWTRLYIIKKTTSCLNNHSPSLETRTRRNRYRTCC